MSSDARPVRRAVPALGALVWALAAGAPRPLPAAPSPAPAIHMGVIAEEPSEPGRVLSAFGDLVACLRSRLAEANLRVGELVIARDLEELSQRVVRGEVDIVIETVFPTLVLQERSGALDPALVAVRRGQREYRCVFFTRRDGPIRRLSDLRGRTLVLQARRSTSAFALPRAELARAGIALVPADDLHARRENVRYLLAMAEINQAVWVVRGKGDAGAFHEGNWAALPERVRSRLRIFHETRPIVRGLLSFRKGVPPGARRRVEDVLLELDADEAGRAALDRAGGLTRFERLTPADRRGLAGWGPILRPGYAP